MELDYKKYRWFFTSSGKLVVGGKSALQNDELLKILKKNKEEIVVMHTKEPGSPFCAILSIIDNVSKEDIKECAIFTGCFSRAWRERKKKTTVDIFRLSQLYKNKEMKTGTWGVIGPIEKAEIELHLVLTRQEGLLRAVPEISVKRKEILLKICPGIIDKKDILPKIEIELDDSLDQNEVLSALPTGGIKICK